MTEKPLSKQFKEIFFKLSLGASLGLLVAGLISVFRFLLGLHFNLVLYLYHLARQHLFVLFVILIYYGLTAQLLKYWLRVQPEIVGGGGQYLEEELDGRADADWWPVLWRKFIGGLLIIPSGLILGRSGPSILMGAMLAKGLSIYVRHKTIKRASYLLAGVVAGLTASFNTPIFALLFIFTGRSDKQKEWDWLLIFSACLSALSLVTHLFGREAFLPLVPNIPPAKNLWIYLLYIGLGVCLGLARFCYEGLLAREKGLLGNARRDGLVMFAILIVFGYYWPELLGGGYQLTTYLALSNLNLQGLIFVLIGRSLLMFLSQRSGFPGGAFFPTLSMGAVLAVTLSSLLDAIDLISITDGVTALVLILGMAAFWAANLKFPLLGMVLMVEMTHRLDLFLPLCLSCLGSYLTFKCLKPSQGVTILDEI